MGGGFDSHIDEIKQCPRCRTILINVESDFDINEFVRMGQDEFRARQNVVREQYCLTNPQLDQAAWNRRVVEENEPMLTHVPNRSKSNEKSSLVVLMCCPSCGSIQASEKGGIHNCKECGTVRVEAYTIGSKQYLQDCILSGEYEKICDSIRKQYCLNSTQFNQAAWDKRSSKEKRTPRPKQGTEYTPPSYSRIKCPTCQSTNVKKLDVIDRGVSIALVGLASNKLGKSFKCRDCGMTF